MKILKYALVMLFVSALAMSCTEDAVQPQRDGEGDSIPIKPPPPPTIG